MYAVIHTTGPLPAATLKEAVVLLLRVTKADPKVTYMPYICRADSSCLTQYEEDAVDALRDTIDYDALTPWEA